MILWRPVGMHEMRLVFEADMRAFPPRLEGQPIFYPVLNPGYANQIASEWNTKENSLAGYVLRFELPDSYASQFEPHIVGSASHEELWVPAEQLAELNSKVVGRVIAERAFFGGKFRGNVPLGFGLKGKDAYQQISALIATLDFAPFDFAMEISANAPSIFLNHPFWRAAGAQVLGTDARALGTCLERLRGVWCSAPRPAALIEEATLV